MDKATFVLGDMNFIKPIKYLGLLLVFNLCVFPQTSPNKKLSTIANFGQLDDRFYRGAQPTTKQYTELKALGIDTVIDLQNKPTAAEKNIVESLGMHYINIPIKDKTAPTLQDVHTFLNVINASQTKKFYVHCEGGRHRTGDIAAVYRITEYGWGFNKVYTEMKNYDFYTSFGHGKQKQFVIDYINSATQAKN